MAWITIIQTYGLWGILVGSFVSNSIVPVPAEPLMILGTEFFSPISILFMATIGAVLGSILNYYIGKKGIKRFLPKEDSKNMIRARRIFHKNSAWSLVLLGWTPFIGDPLTILAGVFHTDFKKFLFFITLGKMWYYSLVVAFGTALPLNFFS